MGDQALRPRDESLWLVLCRSRLIVLLFAMFIYSLGLATLVPVLPTLLTNFFASRHAGHRVDCETYDNSDSPAACQDAHADVVQWTSWTSLVSNTFFGFMFSPLVGDLSDTYGRKPFILGGLALASLPIASVFFYLTERISLLWYYPCNALSSVISTIVVFLSYTADVLPPHQRTAGFGLIIAAYSTGFMVGPQLATILTLDPPTAALVAGGGCVTAIAVITLAVPESRRPAAVLPGCAPAVMKRPRPLDAFISLGRSWELITSSSLFKRLALCMAIVGVVSEGIQDMLIQYLQLVVGFTTKDQGLLFTLLGGANLVVQAALLPGLVWALGERNLLIVGLLFSIIEQALLALSTQKWQALAAVGLGSLAGVSFPAISSIKSTHSRADQQGLVQGALAGIRALATGLGPLAFAWLFAACTKTTAAFGYHPGIVFWTTCGLTVLAAAVAISIPPSLVRQPGAAGSNALEQSDPCSSPFGDERDALLDMSDVDAVATAELRDTDRGKGAAGTAVGKAPCGNRHKQCPAGMTAAAAAPAGDLEQQSDTHSSSSSYGPPVAHPAGIAAVEAAAAPATAAAVVAGSSAGAWLA